MSKAKIKARAEAKQKMLEQIEATRKEKARKEDDARNKEAANPLGAFSSLDDDVANGVYTVGTQRASINVSRLSRDFADYSTQSIDEAVEDAIANLDYSDSSQVQFARHDFQPSGGANYNLQVQLGGKAGNYRVGKGDTSATLVLIDTALFDELKLRNADRLLEVMRAAHRRSYEWGSGVVISPA